MTKATFVALFSSFVLSAAAFAAPVAPSHSPSTSDLQAQLIDAQKNIIDLQKQVGDLEQKIVKTYISNSICTDTEEDCLRERDKFGIMTNDSIALQGTCSYSPQELGGTCAGKHWLIGVTVRILNQ